MLKFDLLTSLTHSCILNLFFLFLPLTVSLLKNKQAHTHIHTHYSLQVLILFLSSLSMLLKKYFCTHFSYFLPFKTTGIWLLSSYPAEILMIISLLTLEGELVKWLKKGPRCQTDMDPPLPRRVTLATFDLFSVLIFLLIK